jgi:hypothetical protein
MYGALEILVLRAWAEPAGTPRLRVRVVRAIPGQADRTVLTTTSAEEASAAVCNWLMSLQQQERQPDS